MIFDALNEGRGRDPGDTVAAPSFDDTAVRSTKAGAETPATHPGRNHVPHARSSLNEGRGRDPGDTLKLLKLLLNSL